MKVTSVALGLLSVAASALAAEASVADALRQAIPLADTFVPNKYILQFEHEAELPSNKRDASVSPP